MALNSRGEGLSPLARGNHRRMAEGESALRPIPAGAGEPLESGPAMLKVRAYPRWRGGTVSSSTISCTDRGLSPLARGNRG